MQKNIILFNFFVLLIVAKKYKVQLYRKWLVHVQSATTRMPMVAHRFPDWFNEKKKLIKYACAKPWEHTVIFYILLI